MPTTTLRLPTDLRDCVSKLAQQLGMTPHSFMLEAIAERVANEELLQQFVKDEEARLVNMLEQGEGLDWSEMRDYLRERASGNEPAAPEARRWRDWQ